MTPVILAAIGLALIYDFLNGMNDAANSIATVVSTKVLSPRLAVLWAALFNFMSYFIFDVSIAKTIGTGIIEAWSITEIHILSALAGAGVWVFICTVMGLPISVSHALIGGLTGPVLLSSGPEALIMSGILKIVVFIVVSPLIGFIVSYFLMVAVMWLCRSASPFKADRWFRSLQLVSSAMFSLGHGSNDAQKTMGIIALLLFSAGLLGETFFVPHWVIFTSYTVISLGTLAGGWKVIKTMGVGITKLKPVDGFCAETAGALTLMGTAIFGIPVSTTHTIAGSIAGAGVTRRVSGVKWVMAYNIFLTWIVTMPVSALAAAVIYAVITAF